MKRTGVTKQRAGKQTHVLGNSVSKIKGMGRVCKCECMRMVVCHLNMHLSIMSHRIRRNKQSCKSPFLFLHCIYFPFRDTQQGIVHTFPFTYLTCDVRRAYEMWSVIGTLLVAIKFVVSNFGRNDKHSSVAKSLRASPDVHSR